MDWSVILRTAQMDWHIVLGNAQTDQQVRRQEDNTAQHRCHFFCANAMYKQRKEIALMDIQVHWSSSYHIRVDGMQLSTSAMLITVCLWRTMMRVVNLVQECP